MKLLFILTLLISSSAFAQMDCEVEQKITKNSQITTSILPLTAEVYANGSTVYRGELENMYFSVRPSGTNDILAIISEGPNYTHGTTVRAGFTEDNNLRVAIVFQNTVFSLKCSK